jgi:MFS family permease
LSWEIMVFGPLTAGWLLCRVAKRNALDWRWPVAACVLIAVLLAFLTLSWNPKYSPGEKGVFIIGLNYGSSLEWFLLTLLPKFALAFGVGLALVWREKRRDRGEISDSAASLPTLPAA